MKNMNSSEGDFALLLLAEKQAAISEKNWGTNKRTSKHTNVTQIISGGGGGGNSEVILVRACRPIL